METSAANRTNVEDTFYGVVREIRRRQREAMEQQQGSPSHSKTTKSKGIKGFIKSVFKR